MKLNLGCGQDKKKGYINCDFFYNDADMVFDLNKTWPFKDSQAEEIIMCGVLEHLDDICAALKEAHRVLKPRGRLIIDHFPYFTAAQCYADVTHKHIGSWETFRSFVKGYGNATSYYQGNIQFSEITQRIVFGKKYALWNYIIEPIMNWIPLIYEYTFLHSIFPALFIRIKLIK